MTDNKQNSETQNTSTQNTSTQNASADNKTNFGGGTASAQRASDKPENNKPAANGESVTETVGKAATEAAGQAKDKAVSLIGEQKANLATGINSVADSIRQIGENLRNDGGSNQIASLAGKYGDTVAGQVEKFSHYVEGSDLKEVARDVEKFARRNPALFVGGAFALGVLAARFLKSSGSAKSRSGSSTRKNSTAVQAS